MPYKKKPKALPKRVEKALPEHAEHIYKEAFDNAWDQYGDPGKRRKGKKESREAVAHKIAWATVKKKYKKVKQGGWEKK